MHLRSVPVVDVVVDDSDFLDHVAVARKGVGGPGIELGGKKTDTGTSRGPLSMPRKRRSLTISIIEQA